MGNNIIPDSFIAVSDFHGNDWPFDKVEKYYLNEYDKIFILGDATDRGQDGRGLGSIELLLNIKSLSEKYPDRVIYVPGNHDQLLYNYAIYNEYDAKVNLLCNGGEITIVEYENLKRAGYSLEISSLMKWLGKLPLQRKHEFNGKKYAFAHAFFNQKLYDNMPDFCLDDLYKCKNSKVYDYLMDILWFRKANDGYVPDDLPKDGSIVVIGHTPLKQRQRQNLDLENSDGEIVKVYCVDGGIAHDNRMLKYDGGSRSILTNMGSHIDTSPKDKNDIDLDSFNEDVKVFNDLIVDIMKNSSNREKAYLNLRKLYLTGDVSKFSTDAKLVIKSRNLSPDKIKNIVRLSVEENNNVCVESKLEDLYFDYVEEISLRHVVTSLGERFGSTEQTTSQLCSLFEKKDYTSITESVGKARTVAKNLGIDTMKKVIKKKGYNKVYDYVVSELKKGYGGK